MSSPFVRRRPAIVRCDDPILPTKVAATPDPLQRLATLPTRDAQCIAHGAGRVA